jgi:hypothetical protein
MDRRAARQFKWQSRRAEIAGDGSKNGLDYFEEYDNCCLDVLGRHSATSGSARSKILQQAQRRIKGDSGAIQALQKESPSALSFSSQKLLLTPHALQPERKRDGLPTDVVHLPLVQPD